MAYAIQAAKDKEEAKLAGTYGACNECKTTSNVRRCTGMQDSIRPPGKGIIIALTSEILGLSIKFPLRTCHLYT